MFTKNCIGMIAVLALPLLVTTGRSADDAGKAAKEFTSKVGGFSAAFPGTPKESKEPIAKDGTIQTQYTLDGPTGAYLVSFQDNPNLAKAGKVEREKALQAAQDAVQRGTQGKLLRSKEITLDKVHPGREYEIQASHGGGGLFRSRAYLVKDRLYQVIVVGQKDFATSKEADRFLESFKLVK